jgi:hypothetical protein
VGECVGFDFVAELDAMYFKAGWLARRQRGSCKVVGGTVDLVIEGPIACCPSSCPFCCCCS